jgi:hypothetical protein
MACYGLQIVGIEEECDGDVRDCGNVWMGKVGVMRARRRRLPVLRRVMFTYALFCSV